MQHFRERNCTTRKGVVVDNAVVSVVVLLDDEGSPLVSMWDAAAAWHGIIPMFSPCNKLYINMN